MVAIEAIAAARAGAETVGGSSLEATLRTQNPGNHLSCADLLRFGRRHRDNDAMKCILEDVGSRIHGCLRVRASGACMRARMQRLHQGREVYARGPGGVRGWKAAVQLCAVL